MPDIGPADSKGFAFLPLGAHYQLELGSVKIGGGLSAFTIILVTLWWSDMSGAGELRSCPVARPTHGRS